MRTRRQLAVRGARSASGPQSIRVDDVERSACFPSEAIALVESEEVEIPNPTGRGEPTTAGEPESLSAFIARVLNQLSLSAWLPGAVLIAGTALLAWFRYKKAVTLDGAGLYVDQNWIPVLVLAIPALVVATLLTQAFSFEAIRTLEGYWRRRGPATWLRTGFIKFRAWRMLSLQKRYETTAQKLFTKARPALLREGVDGAVLLGIEAELAGAQRQKGLTKKQHDEISDLKWWWYSEPWDAARFLRMTRDLKDYPHPSRVMATKLGNVIRVTEDRLTNRGGDIEGFVMRNRHLVSTRVLMQHDQFRTRLDMYCTLVFVAEILAFAAVLALRDLPGLGRFAVVAIFIALACASYGAAISSARGYCTTLLQIDAMAAANSVTATPSPQPSQSHPPGTSVCAKI